jgi:hypothetical protein
MKSYNPFMGISWVFSWGVFHPTYWNYKLKFADHEIMKQNAGARTRAKNIYINFLYVRA